MNDAAPRHPEVETMTAFVEGTLPSSELDLVTEHLAGCEDCRTVVSGTAQFERDGEHRLERKRSAPLKWWLVVAAAFGAALLSIPLVQRVGREPSPVAILIDAAPHDHRTVEPRLAGFPWARLQAPARGNAELPPAVLKLAGAAGTVLERTAGQTGPESRHAAGLASLFIGRANDSIAALEQAASRSSDASVWSDLAAARYVAAVADSRTAQLPLALAAVDRALRIEPGSPEALFNRALILERMELRDQARRAWQSHLAAEPAGGWAVEARERIRRLEDRSERSEFSAALQRAAGDPRAMEALVRAFPRDARAWAEAALLAEWADAEGAGDSALANGRLALVRSLAEALAEVNGERLAKDAVDAVSRSEGETRSALAGAYRLFREARIDYRERRAANEKFHRAVVLFHRGGSPMEDVARYYAASTLIDENQGDAAYEALRGIQAGLHPSYRALAAQVRWELAICASIAGDWGSTLREADAASALFTALGEQTNAASVDGIAAYALERMGATDLAWSRRIRAIAALRGDAHGHRRGAILHGAALGLESGGRIAAAESVTDLVIEDGSNTSVALLTLSLADRARLATRSGDIAAAQRSLNQARSAAVRMADAGLREMALAKIELGEAVLLRTANPRGALPAFDRAIAYFARHQSDALLADAYLQRARAFRAAGDDRAAAADYASALLEVGRQRRSARDSDVSIAFLDTADQIAEESIQLHLSRRSFTAALEIAESLQTLLREDAPRFADRAPMPQGVVAIRYVLLPGQLAIFCVTSDGIIAESVLVDREQLEARVALFAERVRRRAPIEEIQAGGAALYSLLIAPLQAVLEHKEEIVVIPDRQLHIVPFAALYDQGRRQYLAERFTIRIAPSVAGAGPIMGDSLRPAVVIADPLTPLGPRLPASLEEAEQIAVMHGATLISGRNATLRRVTESAGGSALIHYAGHADSDFAEAYGALLLAPSGEDRGILGSSEISRLSLTRHPLVVLAACGTARGEAVHIAGMASLARAFLDAGARAVVGTLWEIDDDVSSKLFLHFHERLRQGTPPARALRDAQIAMLQSADARLAHPATWGTVAVISNQRHQ